MEIIIRDAFGDRPVMEESEIVAEIEINELSKEQQPLKSLSTKEKTGLEKRSAR